MTGRRPPPRALRRTDEIVHGRMRYGIGYHEGQHERGAPGQERHGLGYREAPERRRGATDAEAPGEAE